MRLKEGHPHGYLHAASPGVSASWCISLLMITATFLGGSCGGRGYPSVADGEDNEIINRASFPSDFVFGVGSSAYQSEGAADQQGRGLSIWDTFTKLYPEKISDHSSGLIADEFYYRFQEDIKLLKAMGWDFFRFSISWPRIAPHGKISKGVNEQGVAFYNNLIDNLLAEGIQRFVTLFHWDVPQALEDEYGGFLSLNIVEDYIGYVNFCFREYGDRVKHWTTINEPNYFTIFGYATGSYAPGRCSIYINNYTTGNSATEPYIVGHHLLLSHAAAVQLYRNKYQAAQNGKIGMVIASFWMTPKYSTNISRKAASRALDFQFGWFAHPITYGDYPQSMRRYVGEQLPKFTKAQSEALKGSHDYIGVNYYTARYVDESTSPFTTLNLSYTTDCHCNLTAEKDGIPIGQPTAVSWLYIYPRGIRDLMRYVKKKYEDPTIYLTENGMADANNKSLPIEDALMDRLRTSYFQLHLSNLSKAIEEGVNVRGYFAWGFLDDFEWAEGYTTRYGLTFVDYGNGLKRYLKHSACWFKSFLRKDNDAGRDYSSRGDAWDIYCLHPHRPASSI
ncbi:beta-glucosidase 17-like [Rhodamnia argentea]|uniref:Beta-glucosidase 17-like n=1 Tax=Rhodamnia argentea TaxID=178133 RepID=A0A8B8QLV3_9MYRT|nr:beta-glucosidase 17-like [Rhodamnia argentea]